MQCAGVVGSKWVNRICVGTEELKVSWKAWYSFLWAPGIWHLLWSLNGGIDALWASHTLPHTHPTTLHISLTSGVWEQMRGTWCKERGRWKRLGGGMGTWGVVKRQGQVCDGWWIGWVFGVIVNGHFSRYLLQILLAPRTAAASVQHRCWVDSSRVYNSYCRPSALIGCGSIEER